MLGLNFTTKIFGNLNERKLRPKFRVVEEINALEPKFQAMSDEQLKAMTPAFKERLANGETLDDLLPEAFAVVREAAKRTLGQRHFDVQIVGGMVLHEGAIAEMKTGEGKTLVATLPVYLNSLTGKGVHVVTVNDYLAKRDSEWMGQIYKFLGLTVGVHRARIDRRRTQRSLCRRRHLRHQQRVRLRLSARQHEIQPEHHGAARAQLRHRRRSGLDPGRRSAYAADHFGAHRGPDRILPQGGCAHPVSHRQGLRTRRKAAPGHADRRRQRAHGGAVAGGRRCLPKATSTTSTTSRSCTTSTRRSRRTSCSRKTATTSSRTTKSSSSTNSPGA